jgi:hypothetical protein
MCIAKGVICLRPQRSNIVTTIKKGVTSLRHITSARHPRNGLLLATELPASHLPATSSPLSAEALHCTSHCADYTLVPSAWALHHANTLRTHVQAIFQSRALRARPGQRILFRQLNNNLHYAILYDFEALINILFVLL